MNDDTLVKPVSSNDSSSDNVGVDSIGNLETPDNQNINKDNSSLHHVFTAQDTLGQISGPLDESPRTMQVDEKPKRNYKKLITLFTIFLVFFLVLGIPTSAIAIAYGKLPASKSARNKIQKVLFAIPFIPKTKEFVLMNSFAVHKNVASAYVDASLAGKVIGFDPTLQTFLNPALLDGQSDTFEISVKGFVSTKDKENPISKINVNMANQLVGDMLRSKDSFYFKVDKVPTILSTYIGMINGSAPSIEPLLDKWVYIDTSKLNTDANDIINKNKRHVSEDLDGTKYAHVVDKFISDRIMGEIVMSEDTLGGVGVYKFHLDITDQLLDDFSTEMKKADEEIRVLGYSTNSSPVDIDKPSEYFHDVSVDFWIDKESFYLKRADMFMRIKDDTKDNGAIYNYTFGSGEETVEVAISVTLSQIGETFAFDPPSQFMTIEEYGAEVGRIVMGKPNIVE